MFIRSAAKQLIDVRTKLFASPSAYFDPFASPTLFLRAPGRDTPRTHADALGMLDDEMTFDNETEIDEGWEAVGGKDDYSLSTQTPPPGAGKDDLENLNIDTNALSRNAASNEPSSVQQDLDTITEAIGADSFGPYDDDHHAKSASSTPAATDTSRSNSNSSSLSHTGSKQPKRRKVLRRWPSISRPEDVMLPYFNVYVSPPPSPDLENSATRTDNGNVGLDAGMNALLRMQGIELADLLRRACFYDREKGVGEERVKLTEVGGDGDHVQDRGSRDAKAGEEQRTRAMVEWLRWRLESQ